MVMTKKELIDKLKELGVYDQWKKNVRIDALDAQIPFYSRCYHLLNEGLDWADFLVYSSRGNLRMRDMNSGMKYLKNNMFTKMFHTEEYSELAKKLEELGYKALYFRQGMDTENICTHSMESLLAENSMLMIKIGFVDCK